MRHWRITGNSNVAIQTGSTYISDSLTDFTAIPTANLGFWTTPSAKKLIRAIATTTDNRKWQYRRFARQSRNFWQSVVATIIWHWRIAGNSNVAIQTGSTYTPTVWQILQQFRQQTLGFGPRPARRNWPGRLRPRRLRQRPATENGNIDVLLTNLAISGSRPLSQSFG